MPFFIVPAGLWRLWDAWRLLTSKDWQTAAYIDMHREALCFRTSLMLYTLMLYTISWCIGHCVALHCVALLRVSEQTIRECNMKRWTSREHFNWWKWTQLSWWNVIMKRHVNVTWILKIVPLRLRSFVATQFQRWALGVDTRGCFRSSIL